MLSSRSRILANLNAKENLSPSRKRSSEEAFSLSSVENVSKRRTVDSFELPQVKSKSLFSNKPVHKSTARKQMSIKSYYREGQKENRPVKREQEKRIKIFNENKEETKKKPKQDDDAFSMMCAEEAPEKYWELLAEERRKGLEVALKENKELADEIREKDETIRELRTEVDELKETAKHAQYLASVLEELGKDCNISIGPHDNEEEESENSDSESDEEDVFDEKDISVSYPEEEPSTDSPTTSKENSEHTIPTDSEGSSDQDLKANSIESSDACSSESGSGKADSETDLKSSAASLSSTEGHVGPDDCDDRSHGDSDESGGNTE